ncbi:MAG: hypothetical protein JXA60_08040 [Candidatus Coatesbacteria bacterium]|nr:hypothetical protein [Candidatus Coatesbacteria bacterium]
MARPKDKMGLDRIMRLISSLPQPSKLNISTKTWKQLLIQSVQKGETHWINEFLGRKDIPENDKLIGEAVIELIAQAKHLKAENEKLKKTLNWIVNKSKDAAPWEELTTCEINAVAEEALYATQ